MSEEFYTVEHAARRLKLHRTTILRFIREGRLPAVKVGKSYRILRSDLNRLAGGKADPGAMLARAVVTSIVDISAVDADHARHLAGMVTAALQGRGATATPLRAEVVYDPDNAMLKIVIMGSPNDSAQLLGLLHFWLER